MQYLPYDTLNDSNWKSQQKMDMDLVSNIFCAEISSFIIHPWETDLFDSEGHINFWNADSLNFYADYVVRKAS